MVSFKLVSPFHVAPCGFVIIKVGCRERVMGTEPISLPSSIHFLDPNARLPRLEFPLSSPLFFLDSYPLSRSSLPLPSSLWQGSCGFSLPFFPILRESLPATNRNSCTFCRLTRHRKKKMLALRIQSYSSYSIVITTSLRSVKIS